MVVEIGIVMGANITARKIALNPAQKVGINCHEVFVFSVLRAVFHHPDLVVTFHNLGFDFSNLLVNQDLVIFFPGNNLFPSFDDAFRA